MNETLKIVLSLSLSGSILILILHLLRPLFKERLSKRWQYYIWLVVVARLLLPFAPETNLMGTLFQGIDKGMEQVEIVAPPIQSVSDDGAHQSGHMENGRSAPTAPVINPAQNNLVIALQNLWLVWLVIALILFIRKITIYQSFVKYIRAGCKEVVDIDLLERFGKLVEQNKSKNAVELYTNSLISSPLLIGFFRPCIVLPTADLPPADFEYTIRHELTHFKRRDMFYKWLLQFTVCVHWFNPLVYLMSREVGQACELSCDEAVIKALEPQERRAYGDTLLNAIRAGGVYKESLASVTLSESKERLKERLDAIMKFKKTTRLTAAISVMLILVLCFGATVAGAYAAESKESTSPKPEQTSTDQKTKVIHEEGVYYIFCNGADESGKPSCGVTEGNIMFVLVRKDSYTSMGGFDNLERLVNDVTKQCNYMLEKQFISQDEAKLIVEVATKIQSGEDSEFIDYKAETSYDNEYAEWGIERKDGAFYYNNERLRIFMDLRADNSFSNFKYDEQGTVDLKLVRDDNGNIKAAENLTEIEVEEILEDLDISYCNVPDFDPADISRITKDDVSSAVLNAIKDCDTGKWYVIKENGYQYIYYYGLPRNYAYEPIANTNGLNVNIVDIGKTTVNYVLLSVPHDLKLTVYYNSSKVTYSYVSIEK